MIKINWQKLKKSKIEKAFLTYKILRGFLLFRIGLPHKWAIRIAVWLWLRKRNISL